MVRAQTLSFLAAGGKGAVLAGATDRRTGRRCQGGSGQWCGLRFERKRPNDTTEKQERVVGLTQPVEER